METRADGPGWDPEDLRRLVEAEPEVVVHDEDRALIEIEASEAALELIAPGDMGRKVHREVDPGRRCFRHRERIDVDLDAPSALVAARFAIAGVDQEPMEPGLEAIGIAQGGAGATPRSRFTRYGIG